MSASETEQAREVVARADLELKRVRRAAARADAARAELEHALKDARDAGHALRPIAEAAGLSVEWTRRLIAKDAA